VRTRGETVRQYDDEDGCSGAMVCSAYKFAVVVEQKRAMIRKKKGGKKNERGVKVKWHKKAVESGCWLRKNKTNRLLTPIPLFPSPFPETRYGNSLNWSAETSDARDHAVTTLPNASFITAGGRGGGRVSI